MSVIIPRYFVVVIFENLKAFTKYPGKRTSEVSLRSLRIDFVGSSLTVLKITQKGRLLVADMTRKLVKPGDIQRSAKASFFDYILHWVFCRHWDQKESNWAAGHTYVSKPTAFSTKR